MNTGNSAELWHDGEAIVSSSAIWNIDNLLRLYGESTFGESPSLLRIETGGEVSSAIGEIGVGNWHGATAIVTDPGSSWTVTGHLRIAGGPSSTATLKIQAGASISSAEGFVSGELGSSALITGSGSRWTNTGELTVGQSGDNSALTISDSGRVESGVGTIASNVVTGLQSRGTVTVTGNGSIWSNSEELIIGRASSGGAIGTLRIEAGGRVESAIGNVGFTPGGRGLVTITGEGSTWFNSGSLNVGVASRGPTGSILEVVDRGTVESSTGFIGLLPASVGAVQVRGPGSAWTTTGEANDDDDEEPAPTLVVGHQGVGSMTIEAAGRVESLIATIGNAASSRGAVTVRGIVGEVPSLWQSGSLTVGSSGMGELDIEAGGEVDGGVTVGTLGELPGSQGTVNVTGEGSKWKMAVLHVGNGGQGGLTIEQQGRVETRIGGTIATTSGSEGSAIVRGGGSAWMINTQPLIVGNGGTGELRIEQGGLVESPGGELGNIEDSVGAVTVTGNGSAWDSGPLLVGKQGQGSLTIEAGGRVDSGIAVSIIGESTGPQSNVTVTGEGSLWNAGVLLVGDGGQGGLTIQHGGFVESRAGIVSTLPGASGTVTVVGDGSLWENAEDLRVGLAGHGNLFVLDGASVSNEHGHIGGNTDGSHGIAVVGDRATWFNSGGLFVGSERSAELILSGGTVSTGSGLFVLSSGRLLGNGTIVGEVINEGIVSLGESVGAITIDGSYEQAPSGVLAIEYAGLDDDQFDVLDVRGNVTLGGTLEMRFIDGYVPTQGDVFGFLRVGDGGELTGGFVDIVFPNLVPGFEVSAAVFADGVYRLTALNDGQLLALPGDFNGDGVVDAADYTVWRDNLGGSDAALMGNGTGDASGLVVQSDYDLWQSNFGATAASLRAGSSPTPAVVPEPATWPLVVVGLGLALKRKALLLVKRAPRG